MKKVETINKTVSFTKYTCDFCGKTSPLVYAGIKECIICKKDVCPECGWRIDFELDLHQPHFLSDYPEHICKSCWRKGEEIRHKINETRNDAEEIECNLVEEWKKL